MKRCPKCNFLNEDFAASCGSCGVSFGFGKGKKSKSSKTNPYAKYSLIFGIVSIPLICLCLGWIPGAIAIVFGAVARYRIKRSQDTQTGATMALIGIILGIVSVGAAVALLIYAAVSTDPAVREFWQNLDVQLKESGNN
ncbi:DUF4190 domain-containing protein [Acetivibrio mesophilus]|uniref:DUF4190 domain-containing protein n=1 Tax=Acetivibrio mesophilus TaxID=2487273 RepID=A0A4Q0I7L8_9FIRM|nr:DUF4190 domain-containing protein [Acetivibrio mesophilus]ODM27812.1 hypothetical protein A7W90_17195 [Clostridium sp. Bc-iso-3]RXE59012.1 DUF4190 domain-containing protein [Acetivibrio mesophilus]HHV30122.1 DUF4190 domain-containing protein [Clostridium sp.]